MSPPATADLSTVLVTLMKGVTYRESDPALWSALAELQPRVRDYVVMLGLELVVDDAEGYAYLRHRPAVDTAPTLPRLVPRHPLGYAVSLILALLRRKLAEFDAKSSDARLILGRAEIADLVSVFLPQSGDEARVIDRLDVHINRIIDLGFLRRLRGSGDQYEVRRILKAFVDAQWLSDFEGRLAQYRDHGSATQSPPEDSIS